MNPGQSYFWPFYKKWCNIINNMVSFIIEPPWQNVSFQSLLSKWWKSSTICFWKCLSPPDRRLFNVSNGNSRKSSKMVLKNLFSPQTGDLFDFFDKNDGESSNMFFVPICLPPGRRPSLTLGWGWGRNRDQYLFHPSPNIWFHYYCSFKNNDC